MAIPGDPSAFMTTTVHAPSLGSQTTVRAPAPVYGGNPEVLRPRCRCGLTAVDGLDLVRENSEMTV